MKYFKLVKVNTSTEIIDLKSMNVLPVSLQPSNLQSLMNTTFFKQPCCQTAAKDNFVNIVYKRKAVLTYQCEYCRAVAESVLFPVEITFRRC